MAEERKLIGHSDVVLDGEVDIKTARRTAIKLAEKPKLIVAIPIGSKPVSNLLPGKDGQVYEVNDGGRYPGLVPAEFFLSHMNWIPPLNVSMAYLIKKNMISSHARQVMTKEAIRMEAEYIFYVDDDTLIPPLGLYTLYNFMERNPHAGAVSGVYTTRERPNEPLIYQEHGAGCAWDFEMGPDSVPELCFGAGAGCLLARLSAVQDTMAKLEEERGEEIPIWADERDIPTDFSSPTQQRVMWGHDIRFCRLLNLYGHPVYVDGRVLCGHQDVKTDTTFTIPGDAPGFQKTKERLGNINTTYHWNRLYREEDPHGLHRAHLPVYEAVLKELEGDDFTNVTELGCGNGCFGTYLSVKTNKTWVGYDFSKEAVEICRSRFLTAEVLDLKDLTTEPFDEFDVVVIMETLEHLTRSTALHVLETLGRSKARKIIITVPNNCMGPDVEPEHSIVFNEEVVQGMLGEVKSPFIACYDEVTTTDGPDSTEHSRLICTLER